MLIGVQIITHIGTDIIVYDVKSIIYLRHSGTVQRASRVATIMRAHHTRMDWSALKNALTIRHIGMGIHASVAQIWIGLRHTGTDRNAQHVQTITHNGMVLNVSLAIVITSLHQNGMAQRASRATIITKVRRTGIGLAARNVLRSTHTGMALNVLIARAIIGPRHSGMG